MPRTTALAPHPHPHGAGADGRPAASPTFRAEITLRNIAELDSWWMKSCWPAAWTPRGRRWAPWKTWICRPGRRRIARVDADLDVSAVPGRAGSARHLQLLRRAISPTCWKTPAATARAKSPCQVLRSGAPRSARVRPGLPGVPLDQRERIFSPSTACPAPANARAAGPGAGAGAVIAGRHNGSVHLRRPRGWRCLLCAAPAWR